MSNAVVSLPNQNWTPEQMKLITDVVARGATKDELQLFLYRCQNLGLDPLKPGQIYFIKYNPNSPGTIVVGIEGFRARAGKTGKLSGIKRGAIRDDKGTLIGAYAEVYRSDWKEPAREEVPLSEYNTGKNNWAKMPETMIKKVAEAAALRMAFPDDLGGVYTQEEMDQASERTPGHIYPEQPSEGDGYFSPGDYVINIKISNRQGELLKGKKLKDLPVDELRDLIVYFENKAEKEPLGRGASDIVKYGTEYIVALENGEVES